MQKRTVTLNGETVVNPTSSMTFYPESTETICDVIVLDVCDGIRDNMVCLKKLAKYGVAVFNKMEAILDLQEELPPTNVGNGNGDRYVDWGNEEIGETPPEPVFNQDDSDDCRVVVNRKYDTALQMVTDAETNEKRIETSYERILMMQSDYGINLARNAEFRDWCVADVEPTYNRGRVVPIDMSSFNTHFGTDHIVVEDFVTIDSLKTAIEFLF